MLIAKQVYKLKCFPIPYPKDEQSQSLDYMMVIDKPFIVL